MKPEEIEAILEGGVSLSSVTYLLIVIACIASSFFASYLSSYTKEKGKNYATREDLEELIKQTKELTSATELVKAEISDKNLKSTKQWELKFQIYREVLESLGAWRNSIEKMTRMLFKEDGTYMDAFNRDEAESMGVKVQDIFSNLATTEALAEIVFTQEQSEEIRIIRKSVMQGIEDISGKEAFDQAVQKLQNLEIRLAREAKNELFN